MANLWDYLQMVGLPPHHPRCNRALISLARVDPIPFSVKNDVTGLGKRAQDERMIETTVSQRRGLDSERQIKETIEQRQSREVCLPRFLYHNQANYR